MKKLFGTDGIRGVAGQSPLDAPTVYAVGLALAHTLAVKTASPRVLLGMDTRESSDWIAARYSAPAPGQVNTDSVTGAVASIKPNRMPR